MALSQVSRGSYNPSFAREEQVGAPTTGIRLPPSQPESPVGGTTPFGFDETSRTVWVNGTVFDADDHDSALKSKSALDQPTQVMPSNFRPMELDEFGAYLNRIKNPSAGRLIKKGLAIGADVTQQLAGSTLKFLGAEETGQAIIDQQTEDMRFNQPYQRQATDIRSGGDAGDWFVANAAQMAPLMAAMILSSLATGGVSGAVASASATGARLLARGASKKLISNANLGLQKLRSGQKLAPKSPELLALRRAGRINGAKIGAIAAAEGVAIGDIYQAIEESGNYDSPALARLVTLFASVPYAAAELAPAALALRTAFGTVGRTALTRGSRPYRAVKGFGAGAGIEGSTEAFQEIVTLGVSGKLDFNDPGVINQLINAFAAGAGIGGPIGGVAASFASTPKDATPKIDLGKPEVDILSITDMRSDSQRDGLLEDMRSDSQRDGRLVDMRPSVLRGKQLRITGPEGGVGVENVPGFIQEANRAGVEEAAPEEAAPRADPEDVITVAPESPPDTAMSNAMASAQEVRATQQAEQEAAPALAEQAAQAAAARAQVEQAAQEQAVQEQAVQEQAVQERAAQEQTVQKQAAQDARFSPAELQRQEEQFIEAGAVPAAQMQFPFMGDGSTVLPGGPPTVNLPHKDPRNGDVMMVPVDIREAIEDADFKIAELESLDGCLSRMG